MEYGRIGPVRVISCTRNELFLQHSEIILDDHMRAWDIIREAVTGEEHLLETLESYTTVAEAWTELRDWVLPTTTAHKRLLEAQLINLEYPRGESPKIFLC